MTTNQIPASVQERIKADAEKYVHMTCTYIGTDEHAAYIAGATAEAQHAADLKKLLDEAQALLSKEIGKSWELVKALELAKSKLNWVENADAIEILRNAIKQWKGEKEVGPVKEIEYMPILSAELSELKGIPNVPIQVPMHLLNEEQAFSNHGQSLRRLKERGGLSVRESLSLITRQHWRYYSYLDNKKAVVMLNEIIANTNPPKKASNMDNEIIKVNGLETRTWIYKDNWGYGCAECCNGDRCDDECTAKYRRPNCPHCKGKGWIDPMNISGIVTKNKPH